MKMYFKSFYEMQKKKLFKKLYCIYIFIDI